MRRTSKTSHHGMGRQDVCAAARRVWADIRDYKEVLLLFAAYYIFMHAVFHAFCPLVMLTGFPCAGCGMTRAVFFLLTGQLARSWRMNPMAIPVVLFVVYCAVSRYLLGKRVRGFRTGLFLLLCGLLAVYLFRMTTVFPNRAPYVYTPNNFLEGTVPYYKEILRKILGI